MTDDACPPEPPPEEPPGVKSEPWNRRVSGRIWQACNKHEGDPTNPWPAAPEAEPPPEEPRCPACLATAPCRNREKCWFPEPPDVPEPTAGQMVRDAEARERIRALRGELEETRRAHEREHRKTYNALAKIRAAQQRVRDVQAELARTDARLRTNDALLTRAQADRAAERAAHEETHTDPSETTETPT